jgi:putative transposase
MQDCANKYEWEIETMEIDPDMPDHFHCLVRSLPSIAPYEIVHNLKQYSTYCLWKTQESYLKKLYWKDHYLWTRGYFCATCGNASADKIREYIENQGC